MSGLPPLVAAAISANLNDIAEHFKPEAKVTLLVRNELGAGKDGDLVMTNDALPAAVEALQRRHVIDVGAAPPRRSDYPADAVIRRFVIVHTPGRIPEKKGPFTSFQLLERFIDELIACRPADMTFTVAELTWDLDLWVTSRREWLETRAVYAELTETPASPGSSPDRAGGGAAGGEGAPPAPPAANLGEA